MSDKRLVSVTRTQRYFIDGKEYHSLAEIPESELKKLGPDVVKLLEDKNRDGIPDILQGGGVSLRKTKVILESTGDAGSPTGDIMKNILAGFGEADPRYTEQAKQGIEAIQLKQREDELKRERTRYIVIIVALVALVAFLLLKRF
jgi:hypothetical protein